ncbi:MAG: hypothetical protein V4456_11460 [Bacteroidota bacterium]
MDNDLQVVKMVSAYVIELLSFHLPKEMVFHNLHHTEQVVVSVIEFSQDLNLSLNDRSVLQTAAWFHDTGYCYGYTNHEDISKAIAGTFLRQLHCKDEYIQQVNDCISATRIPQKPHTLLQEIICDADFFHFSRTTYQDDAGRLRTEWETFLKKSFSSQEWDKLNLDFLQSHSYFTSYGRDMLQERKERNIKDLGRKLAIKT